MYQKWGKVTPIAYCFESSPESLPPQKPSGGTVTLRCFRPLVSAVGAYVSSAVLVQNLPAVDMGQMPGIARRPISTYLPKKPGYTRFTAHIGAVTLIQLQTKPAIGSERRRRMP